MEIIFEKVPRLNNIHKINKLFGIHSEIPPLLVTLLKLRIPSLKKKIAAVPKYKIEFDIYTTYLWKLLTQGTILIHKNLLHLL